MFVTSVGIYGMPPGRERDSFLEHVTLSNPVQGKVFDKDVNLHFTEKEVCYNLEEAVYALKVKITGWIDCESPTTMDFVAYELRIPTPFIIGELCHVDHSGGGRKSYDCSFPLPPVGFDIPKVPRCSTG